MAGLRPARTEPIVRCDDRLLVEHPARLVDGDCRQRVLVHVHSDHDHSDRLLNRWGRPASGQASIEAAAKLLSGHARRSRVGGGDTTLASQLSGDMRESSQPPPPESASLSGRHHQPRMTLRTPPPAENDIEFRNITRSGLALDRHVACRRVIPGDDLPRDGAVTASPLAAHPFGPAASPKVVKKDLNINLRRPLMEAPRELATPREASAKYRQRDMSRLRQRSRMSPDAVGERL
jgi:hypothetical protein